jgi:hypothetical protein
VIALYGALIALNVTFLCEGVKYYGALRAVMTIDYSDLPIVYLIGSFLGRFFHFRRQSQGRRRDGGCLCVDFHGRSVLS